MLLSRFARADSAGGEGVLSLFKVSSVRDDSRAGGLEARSVGVVAPAGTGGGVVLFEMPRIGLPLIRLIWKMNGHGWRGAGKKFRRVRLPAIRTTIPAV